MTPSQPFTRSSPASKPNLPPSVLTSAKGKASAKKRASAAADEADKDHVAAYLEARKASIMGESDEKDSSSGKKITKFQEDAVNIDDEKSMNEAAAVAETKRERSSSTTSTNKKKSAKEEARKKKLEELAKKKAKEEEEEEGGGGGDDDEEQELDSGDPTKGKNAMGVNET
jgi:hypothetical protein